VKKWQLAKSEMKNENSKTLTTNLLLYIGGWALYHTISFISPIQRTSTFLERKKKGH
jgi:hypothetical protein